jgi:hypothetical protein
MHVGRRAKESGITKHECHGFSRNNTRATKQCEAERPWQDNSATTADAHSLNNDDNSKRSGSGEEEIKRWEGEGGLLMRRCW